MVKAKIRFDYKLALRARRFFWEKSDSEEMAKKLRLKQTALLRNLPFQGLDIEVLDDHFDTYTIFDRETNKEELYVPIELLVNADSLEDLMPLTFREEFRKIRVIEPEKISLTPGEIERFIFRANEEYRI